MTANNRREAIPGVGMHDSDSSVALNNWCSTSVVSTPYRSCIGVLLALVKIRGCSKSCATGNYGISVGFGWSCGIILSLECEIYSIGRSALMLEPNI